jgi:O-antigen/teichoic acid export membrane protein
MGTQSEMIGRPPTLSSRLTGAAVWVVLGAGAQHVLRLASNLLVTRLLAPEMFGLVALAGLVPMVLSLLSDVGFRENVCRNPAGDDQKFLDTVFSIQAVRGSLIWLGCLVISAALWYMGTAGLLDPASTYGDPRLPWVIAVSSVSIPIGALHSSKIFTEGRYFRIKGVLKIELISQIFGITLMILLAWLTRSIWSILLSGIFSAAAYSILSHYTLPGPKNKFAWDKVHAAEIMTFGKWLFWSSAFTVFAANADRLVLGGYMTPQSLGFYSIAINLVGAVDLLSTQIFSRVALPGFSEVARSNIGRLSNAYYKLRCKFDPVMLTLSGLLFSAGHLVTDVLYDDRYRSAGEMLEILALGLAFSRYSLAQSVYLAINKPKYQVVLNIVRTVSIYSMLFLGYRFYGLTGALFAIALRELPALPFIFYFNAKHKLNNWQLEWKLLLVWPIAFLAGQAVLQMHLGELFAHQVYLLRHL